MSILVGLHGAAMANIMWMAPGSGAVVEVMVRVCAVCLLYVTSSYIDIP